MVFEVVAGSLDVQEHAVGSADIDEIDLSSFAFGGQEGASGDELDGISEGCVNSDLGQKLEGLFAHLDVLFLAAGLNNLPDLLLSVVFGLDDQQAVEEIQGHAVRTE
jgi:hypothetical protein